MFGSQLLFLYCVSTVSIEVKVLLCLVFKIPNRKQMLKKLTFETSSMSFINICKCKQCSPRLTAETISIFENVNTKKRYLSKWSPSRADIFVIFPSLMSSRVGLTRSKAPPRASFRSRSPRNFSQYSKITEKSLTRQHQIHKKKTQTTKTQCLKSLTNTCTMFSSLTRRHGMIGEKTQKRKILKEPKLELQLINIGSKTTRLSS